MDPRTPVDELGKIASQLAYLQDQIDRLAAPSGTSAYQTVSKLQGLIDDIQAQLDDYIANGTYNKSQIDAKIASPGNIAPGNVNASGLGSFGSTLTASGQITSNTGLFVSPAAYGTIIGATRKAVWIDNLGRIGVTL